MAEPGPREKTGLQTRQLEPMNSQSSSGYSFQTKVASLSLHLTDRIRLMSFPAHITPLIRQTIITNWPRGIQNEQDYYGSREFKVYGNPWLGQGDTATHARRLMRSVLETLYDAGWVLALSTDVSKKQSDKDTLIFRHQEPSPAKSDWISISFSHHDRIRIYDCQRDLYEAVVAAIRPSVQSVVQNSMPGVWEIKIHGYPWHATGGETLSARKLLLQLFEVLEQYGFTVYCSIDQKATQSDKKSETDTWHARRVQGWTPGAPVTAHDNARASVFQLNVLILYFDSQGIAAPAAHHFELAYVRPPRFHAPKTHTTSAPRLDDLCVRFIINLPQEELQSVERICFQIEEAQWFYEDFIRPLDQSLPSMALRPFAMTMFRHCPLFAGFTDEHYELAYQGFMEYKTRVPVRGAILLNEAMDQVVLVRGWKKGSTWSFPRGKINKNERDIDCAIREADEEIGFDVRKAGLVQDEEAVKTIEVTLRDQHVKLFIFRGVSMDIAFQPRTRKEIGKIEWFALSNLPGWAKGKGHQSAGSDTVLTANKLYMVAPFLPQLKHWIGQQRKRDKQLMPGSVLGHDAYLTDDQEPVAQKPPHLGPSLDPNLAAQYAEPKSVVGNLSSQGATGEIKRLLDLNQPTDRPQIAHNVQPQTDLLAMLRGNSSAPASTFAGQVPLEFAQLLPPHDHNNAHHIPRPQLHGANMSAMTAPWQHQNQQSPGMNPALYSANQSAQAHEQQLSVETFGQHLASPPHQVQALSNHAQSLLNAFKAPRKPAALAASPTPPLSIVDRSVQALDHFDISANSSLVPGSIQAPAELGVPSPVPSPAHRPLPNQKQAALLELFGKPGVAPGKARNPEPAQAIKSGSPQKPMPTQENTVPPPAHAPTEIPLINDGPDTIVSESLEPVTNLTFRNPTQKQLFDHRDGKMKAHVRTPRPVPRPQTGLGDAEHSPVTSATIQGPLKTPDFAGSKAKSRPILSDARKAKQASQTPVQILKRPPSPTKTSVASSNASPRTEHGTRLSSPAGPIDKQKTPENSTGRAVSKFEAEQNATPRILRRTEVTATEADMASAASLKIETQATADDASAPSSLGSGPSGGDKKVALLALFERPEHRPQESTLGAIPSPASLPTAAASEQKQALLALFGKNRGLPQASESVPRSVSPKELPASEVSFPTSASISRRQSEFDPSITPLTRSRFGSTASGMPLASPSPLASPGAVHGMRRGSQTPISPVDKGFLFNFLDSFAKGTAQRK